MNSQNVNPAANAKTAVRSHPLPHPEIGIANVAKLNEIWPNYNIPLTWISPEIRGFPFRSYLFWGEGPVWGRELIWPDEIDRLKMT